MGFIIALLVLIIAIVLMAVGHAVDTTLLLIAALAVAILLGSGVPAFIRR